VKSLRVTRPFVGLTWISEELFGKPSGEVHPDRALAKKQQLHQRPNKDGQPPTATVPQPGNPIDHSPSTESGEDLETVSIASEVADEAPVPYREPTVSPQNSTKSSSTQDELVGRAIGMIRSALENGSA
jgi:hypothetical protein